MEADANLQRRPDIDQVLRRPGRPVRVLVLDDDESRCFVAEALRGYAQVIGQASAYRARQVLSVGRFDVLLLDPLLPGINGLAFLEHLPAKDRPSRVIVLTGWQEGMIAARKLGVLEMLRKPCTAETLRDAVLGVPHVADDGRAVDDREP
jgi:DNA-binding NtrC family response regulator